MNSLTSTQLEEMEIALALPSEVAASEKDPEPIWCRLDKPLSWKTKTKKHLLRRLKLATRSAKRPSEPKMIRKLKIFLSESTGGPRARSRTKVPSKIPRKMVNKLLDVERLISQATSPLRFHPSRQIEDRLRDQQYFKHNLYSRKSCGAEPFTA